MTNPKDVLRHHVTGAIERGEAEAIVEQRAIDLYNHPGYKRRRAYGASVEDALLDTTYEIAAALLAALEACQAELYRVTSERNASSPHSDMIVCDARAAIAQARGES